MLWLGSVLMNLLLLVLVLLEDVGVVIFPANVMIVSGYSVFSGLSLCFDPRGIL